MIRQLIQFGFGMTLFTALVAILLAGCGGGGGKSSTDTGSRVALSEDAGRRQSTALAPGTGDITLKWTAPVARADGTPLTLADIKGYVIYYGKSPGEYPFRYEVADGAAQSATIRNIPAGVYYVVMTTYDINNTESAYSTEVMKLVE